MTSMPYGGVINWGATGNRSVHDPAVHHGYRHMVAWSVHLGSYGPYIEAECAKAKAAGAPKDALYLSGTDWGTEPREWSTFSGLREKKPDTAADIEKYVAAMEKLEQERKGKR
jgi:hypothetical protein